MGELNHLSRRIQVIQAYANFCNLALDVGRFDEVGKIFARVPTMRRFPGTSHTNRVRLYRLGTASLYSAVAGPSSCPRRGGAGS
jgi:hypothetical protein